MRVANAPCSWGVLEFESTVLSPEPSRVLDEIAATGFAGTELGDWGFLPTDPAALRRHLDDRRLALVGGFVPVALSDQAAHEAGEALALKTAGLMRATAGDTGNPPRLVLSDATAADPIRTARAGRITTADSLSHSSWHIVAQGAERIARAVLDATGLPTAFHYHCATFVEAPWEIDALMDATSTELLGLCLDTGHATYGGGDPLAILQRYGARVSHVHFKDCSAAIAELARREHWDYVQALRAGLFCELGNGTVDFAAIVSELRRLGYPGWIVVEQDVLPSMGTPAESAARNRAFLERLGV